MFVERAAVARSILHAASYGTAVRFPGQKDFLFLIVSGSALGSTHPPIQWFRGAISMGQSCRGMKLSTNIHLVPRAKTAEI
jgi:hypothetical protein